MESLILGPRTQKHRVAALSDLRTHTLRASRGRRSAKSTTPPFSLSLSLQFQTLFNDGAHEMDSANCLQTLAEGTRNVGFARSLRPSTSPSRSCSLLGNLFIGATKNILLLPNLDGVCSGCALTDRSLSMSAHTQTLVFRDFHRRTAHARNGKCAAQPRGQWTQTWNRSFGTRRFLAMFDSREATFPTDDEITAMVQRAV